MGRRITLFRVPGETRALIQNDGVVTDLFLDRDLQPSLVGGVFRARIKRTFRNRRQGIGTLPSGQDVFIQDRANTIPTLVEGGEVPLQIRRDGSHSKLPVASQRIVLVSAGLSHLSDSSSIGYSQGLAPSDERKRITDLLSSEGARGIVLEPIALDFSDGELVLQLSALKQKSENLRGKVANSEVDCFLSPRTLWEEIAHRFFRSNGDPPEIVADIASLKNLSTNIERLYPGFAADTIRVVEPAEFFEALKIFNEAVDAAIAPEVILPGGKLIFTATEALTAIDVDAEPDASTTEVNEFAAIGVVAQLRLRNLGGLVAIDFAGSPRGKVKQGLCEILDAGLAEDPVSAEFDGPNRLGLATIARQRERPPLLDVIAEPLQATQITRSPTSCVIDALAAVVQQSKYPSSAYKIHLSDGVKEVAISSELEPAWAEMRRQVVVPVDVQFHPGWNTDRFEVE